MSCSVFAKLQLILFFCGYLVNMTDVFLWSPNPSRKSTLMCWTQLRLGDDADVRLLDVLNFHSMRHVETSRAKQVFLLCPGSWSKPAGRVHPLLGRVRFMSVSCYNCPKKCKCSIIILIFLLSMQCFCSSDLQVISNQNKHGEDRWHFPNLTWPCDAAGFLQACYPVVKW